MESFLVGLTLFFGLFGFFVWSYKSNKNTPLPEGMDKSHVCNGCQAKGGCKFRV